MVRASAIEALSYLQNPEYKKDLTTVFTVAKDDKDPNVAEAAKAALDKLNQIQAQPEQAKSEQPKQEQAKTAA
ncbi:unknown [Clostridium sp. CAG:813]|nr:unknown [Clostridium sp. CAG:813]